MKAAATAIDCVLNYASTRIVKKMRGLGHVLSVRAVMIHSVASTMSEANPSDPEHNVCRFGVFELNFVSLELRKSGTRIKLPAQALRILQTLVKNAGEVVTREELRQVLWADTLFVDFDHGLNVMVNRLRDVLGDSAKHPRYIETVPRRGYRFVAPVTRVATRTPSADLSIPAPPIAPTGEPVVTANGEAALGSELQPPQQKRLAHKWRWVLGATLACAAVGFLVSTRTPSEKKLEIIPAATMPGSKDFAAFSPDGNEIVFVWTGPDTAKSGSRDVAKTRDLYRKFVDTGEPLRLTDTPEEELLPAWAPNGKEIAYIRRDHAGKHAVYVMSALGGEARKIRDSGVGLSWSPDSRTLAMVSPPDAQGRNRITLHTFGTAQDRSLSNPGPYSDSFPVFSPDGSAVAFLRSYTAASREVMVVPLTGGDPLRLTSAGRPVWGLAWMTDNYIVYSANLGGGERLWRVPAKGGSPTAIPIASQNAFYPASTRQGSRLVYTQEFTDTNMYVYSGVGFRQSKLLAASTREDHSPSYSPIDDSVAFVSKRTGSEEIWVVPAGGGGARQLTTIRGPATGSPRWSPDGRFIAFDSRIAGSSDIYVIGANGTDLRRLTTTPSEDMLPRWSADGRFVYYTSNQGGTRQIWRMGTDGSAPFVITKAGAFECSPSSDGKLIYFTKDRALPGLYSVGKDGGEERPVVGLEGAGYWRSWGTLPTAGLFFVSPAHGKPAYDINLFSPQRSLQVVLLQVQTMPLWLHSGLSVSRDARSVIWTQVDQSVNDIIVLDGLR